MPYYLEFHFNPDHDRNKLKPAMRGDGSVDHYELGYVQNVIMDQLIAEIREVDEAEASQLDSRFILEHKTLPAGPNTTVNPDNPNQLLARANGHPCWENGHIAVKKVLTIPGNVSFHTGNILFVGDLLVERSIFSGFKVQARNILVKGHIGGAEVTAQESIASESGIKGERQAVINAGKSLRVPFCEHAQLLAKENILIGGVCMHSDLYVGKQLAVRGKLIGGVTYCRQVVYVQEQLGGGSSSDTELVLGYDPFLLHKSELLEEQIEEVEEQVEDLKSQIEKHAGQETELRPKIIALEKKMHAMLSQKIRIWELIKEREATRKCGVVVPGEVRPGVMIRIGEAVLETRERMENVRFTLQNEDIHISSPAMKTK